MESQRSMSIEEIREYLKALPDGVALSISFDGGVEEVEKGKEDGDGTQTETG